MPYNLPAGRKIYILPVVSIPRLRYNDRSDKKQAEEEDGSHLRGTRDGEDLRLVYCGGARFLAVKPDAPDTVVCHLEFLIRAGRAWGVRVGTRVFERD